MSDEEFNDLPAEELLPGEANTEPDINFPERIEYLYIKDPSELTSYERATAIGKRAVQLNEGLPTTLDRRRVPPSGESLDVATEELRQLRLPLIIIRRIPGRLITYVFLDKNLPPERK